MHENHEAEQRHFSEKERRVHGKRLAPVSVHQPIETQPLFQPAFRLAHAHCHAGRVSATAAARRIAVVAARVVAPSCVTSRIALTFSRECHAKMHAYCTPIGPLNSPDAASVPSCADLHRKRRQRARRRPTNDLCALCRVVDAAMTRALNVVLRIQLPQHGATEVRADRAIRDEAIVRPTIRQAHQLNEVVLVVRLVRGKCLHCRPRLDVIQLDRLPRVRATRSDELVTRRHALLLLLQRLDRQCRQRPGERERAPSRINHQLQHIATAESPITCVPSSRLRFQRYARRNIACSILSNHRLLPSKHM